MTNSVRKGKTYAMALGVVAPVIIERENRYWLPEEEVKRPACAWNDAGLLIGSRHFGPMCAPNPLKSTTVKFVEPMPERVAGLEPAVESVATEPEIVANVPATEQLQTADATVSSCILL